MKRLLALLLVLCAAIPAAPGRAQSGPTLFAPGPPPPAPPHLTIPPPEAPAAARLAQTSLRCDQLLLDPPVSLPSASSPWRTYRQARIFSTDEALSSPQSISLVANSDGDPASGPDLDAFGQELTVSAALAELYGTLAYFYAPGSPGAGDQLRVELYETGRVNPGGLITTARTLTATGRIEGSWQQLEWEVTDPAAIERLRALGRAALVITMAAGGSPGTTRLWLDDLTASACVPAASVGGRVTRGGAPAADALVLLESSAAGAGSVLVSTRTAADGSYSFGSVPVQPAGTAYRIWFINRPAVPPRPAGLLGFWAGPLVPQLSAGVAQGGLDFDVADVQLQSPASYAEVVATDAAPAALRWGGRAPASPAERHQLCLYDPARGDLATGLPAQVCGPIIDPSRDERAFSLSPGSFAGAPGFGFAYGRSYRWYVVVYASDPRTTPDAQYGYSFGERAITLLGAPTSETITPPAPQPGDPAGGVAGADWTLLIYMAADNTIGDARRAPNLGRPSGQLASLPTLAAAYPNVNLVSYVDRYGPGGAQLCAYPPGGAPDCRVRAEPNSADPTTLASFIADGRSRYPAARTALLIVAPGQAAGQLALDETAAGAPAVGLGGLEAAYQAASLGGANKLDLVIYQASLLGSVEAMQATAPYARYMVASAGPVWQLGPYRELVPLLGGPSRNDAAAVARGAVAAYATTVAAVGGVRATTWAAYDLGRAAAFGQALDVLAEALQAALSSEATTTRPGVAAARAATQSYDSSGNGRLDSIEAGDGAIALEEDAMLDLRDLADELQLAVGPPVYVQQAAAALATLLDDQAATPLIAASIRSGQSTTGASISLSGARGLGIFFPSGDRLGGQPALAESYLHMAFNTPPGDSLWADMLRTYEGGGFGAGPGGVTEGAGGGSQFRPLPGGFVSTTLYLPLVRR